VDQALTERRAAIDRYLRAFEAGRLSEATCGHRVGALEQEIGALEARRASLLAECDSEPALPTDAAPEQLKRLLDAVVERITVESRACIQPYFLRPRFVRLPLRGGGRESNPPEQGRCSHRF
jgi:predicted trehalose synthase